MPPLIAIGTVIDDRYTLLELLGEGGMGSVYKAREDQLERIVAIKVLHPDLMEDDISKQRFHREGKVLSSLEHPYLIRFFRFGQWSNKYPYIAMEYLEGTSLREVLLSEQKLTSSRCLDIATKVCIAMQAAHDAGIVHRDLSPANLFLQQPAIGTEPETDRIKIIDFGLSIFVEPENNMNQHLTRTGYLVGSPHYMSPEQCAGIRPDHRTDIYSLGCILYQMVAGVPPFDAANPIALVRLHAMEPPPRLPQGTIQNRTSPGLDNAIMRALSKAPADRYQSMDEFRKDLELIASGHGEVIACPPHALPRAKNHRAILRLIALAGICFFTTFTAIFYSKHEVDHTRSKLPELKMNSSTPLPRLRSTDDLNLRSKAERIQYYQSWVQEYGATTSMDAVEAYFQLSQDLAKDDPLLSNKFSQTAAEMARQIFDRSVTKHSGFLAADAAMQVFLIRGFRNETTLLIRELQQMIRQLEATGPGGGTIKALNDCRYKLADLYYSDERYSQALQLLDDTFKNRLSYSFEALQKLSYMIRRSNCLWRLGRPGPAASQLREAYDLSTKMPNLVEYKLDLVRCCAEQQQYVLCNSACNLLEIAAKNSYDASRDHVLASYQIRADCLEAMNRPTEAFQLLQAKIDNWTNLSDQLHAWTEMCRLNARHHMHNEVALIAWIQHKIDELSSPPDNESFQRILGAVITFSTYTLQYGDLLATKRILQCADTFLKRWDRADLDLTTLQFARSIVNQCIRTGNYATAEAVMNDLIKRVEARPGDNYELLNSLYQQIIAVTGEAGENSKSLELIDRFAARPVDEKKYGSDLASRRFARSIILRNLRRFDEAAAEATKGIELFERRKNHTGVTEGMILLGTIEFKRNRLKNADSILSEAAARSALDPGGPRQRALIWLAKTYTEERKLALADSRTEQLVKLSRQGDVARHLSGLLAASDLFELQGNKTRASTIRKEYNDYRESLAPPK